MTYLMIWIAPVARLLVATILVVCSAGVALAQHEHSDVEFVFTDGKIDIEFGDEGQVFESEFDIDGTLEQETDDPGFASETAEGLGVEPNALIDYDVLGPLMYHNGSGFATVPAGAQLVIGDNPSGELVVDAATVGPISGPGAIAQADSSGDVHTHIDFRLEPLTLSTGDYGAYGVLMQLTTDHAGVAASDPFFLVFNFGLEEEEFEGAVGAFAAMVPEPATGFWLAVVLLGPWFRRR